MFDVNAARFQARVNTPIAIAFFSAAFFGLSFFIRYSALNQTTYANGWDAYFYINQVRSFLEEGQMHVPDSSLVYPLMMLIKLFTDDYVLSYKLLGCTLAGFFTASLFLLSLKRSQNCNIAFIVASFSVFSPHLTWFSAQYPKNLLGIIFFLWMLYWIDSKHRLFLLGLLTLNFFGHRTTAVLSFVSLAMYASLQKFTRFIPSVLILFLFTFLVVGFFLPGILNLLDVGRLNGLFSPHPQFAPYSFLKAFGSDLIPPWWQLEIILSILILLAAALFMAVQLRRGKNTVQLAVIILILAFLIFPFFEWSMDGLAFRLFLIFVLLSPLLLAYSGTSVRRLTPTAIICGVLLGCGLFSFKSYAPLKHDPPYALYERVADGLTSKPGKDERKLIIAHKSLAEFIVYSTGIEAMSWVPEYEIDTQNLWRVAEGIKDIQYQYYLENDDLKLTQRLTLSYSLVREDVWNRLLESIKRKGDTEFLQTLTDWKNPHSVRPAFLLKNKRD